MNEVFKFYESSKNSIKAVLHFAGLKSVAESVRNPIQYWDTNLIGTKACLRLWINTIAIIWFLVVVQQYMVLILEQINESCKIKPVNPYGHTKAAVEDLLTDLYNSNKKWSIISLRYFNPVGAHTSGQIGEDPFGIPNNLFPFISQVAVGRSNLEFLGTIGPPQMEQEKRLHSCDGSC